MSSEKDLKLEVLLDSIQLLPKERNDVVSYFRQLRSKDENWLEIEKKSEKNFDSEKLEVIKKHRSDLFEQSKVAFEGCLSGLLNSKHLSEVKNFNNEEFSQFIGGICLAIKNADVFVNTNQIKDKLIEIDNYFKNPNEGFKQKLKRGFIKSVEKLSGFMQEMTGIDPANPLESLKKKMGVGDKQKDKLPVSDSKAIDDFIPSPVTYYGVLFGLSAMGFGSFAAALAPVVVLILAATKIKGVISSDVEKEGTIHNPIRSGKNDYTESATKSVNIYTDKLNNERKNGQNNKSAAIGG